ncbi:MAG: hypothetical protein I3273_03890 [Candidatus Moeniiplasma glomeromycotorum]|nr:hypothetical protein [Candidatus Moeniiplasma glomeromycotorum]MCE8167686.1 hypothetical protein [Candidatus Moeniiplasma glomeromycotorum]MCE8169235.1 hypothetical protein [Candidatus Moeniiplasma glomeromycotorum]
MVKEELINTNNQNRVAEEVKDWTDIHKDFNKEWRDGKTHQQLWEENGFTHEETKELERIFLEGYKAWTVSVDVDWDFYVWLRNEKHLTYQGVQQFGNLKGLWEEYEKSWKEMDGNFEREYQSQWIKNGFAYQTTKEWKEILGENFKPEYDWAFCTWLKDENHLTAQQIQQQGDLEDLRKAYYKLWTDIHERFGEKHSLFNKTHQQLWEEKGLTYQDAQQWIPAEFKPEDYYEVKRWKENFTPQETKAWREVGLTGWNDAKLASYLIDNYTPVTVFQEKSYAQHWLDWQYPSKERNNIKGLNLRNENLTGSLDLSDFPNLEELDFCNNHLTSLKLDKCLKLKKINCQANHLTQINLPKGENLELLWLQGNNFHQDLSFLSGAVNLEILALGSWLFTKKSNKFYGSLEPLKEMKKLKSLDIVDTDIDSGLEYLPENISFHCSTSYRKDAKVKAIAELLAPYNGSVQAWKVAQNKQEELRKAEERRIITLLIPVEKLTAVHSDIKKFLEKWDKEKVDELRNLQELKKYKLIIGSTQWSGRIASTIGGSLLLVGTQNSDSNYTTTGGIIAIVAPFVEVITSQLEKSLYEKKKGDWENFVRETEKAWYSYRDLVDVLESIRDELITGEIKEILIDLKKKVDNFSKGYDLDGDEKISDSEWKKASKQFPQDLKINWDKKEKELIEIQKATENLQKSLSDYRDSDKVVAQSKVEGKKLKKHQVIDFNDYEANRSFNSSQANLSNKSQQKEEIAMQNLKNETVAQIEQLPYGTSGSSK